MKSLVNNIKNNNRKIKGDKESKSPKNKTDKNPHLLMYNKEFYEVNYLEINCPICHSRIDELGYCACDSHL